MSCERMETLLISYLEGRAAEAERTEVEAHLAACPACRNCADEFRRLWVVLDELPAVEPSLAFDARVRARVAAEPRRRFWAWLVPQPRLVMAVVALLLLAIWISTRPPAPVVQSQSAAARTEEDFRVVKDLPVLENYDVLANFDVLSTLPAPTPQTDQEME